MRVQQQLHAVSVQNSSGNGSSKSSLVQIAPACSPATRGVVDNAIGTKRASGVVPSVRTISVPSRTKDSSSCKFVWASRTSTVFVSMTSSPTDGVDSTMENDGNEGALTDPPHALALGGVNRVRV